jgi:bacillithiol biosynthesis deacetylase BshB1
MMILSESWQVVESNPGEIRMLDILVIAPHPDDAELGMGGAVVKLLADGLRVGVLDLSDGEPTPHGSVPVRAKEAEAASRVLGLAWRENLGLPNRRIESTLEARQLLAEVIRRETPRLLFAPYWVDSHPDHVAATQLVEAARFWAKLTKSDLAGKPHYPERIYYYFSVHLKLAPQPAFILDISHEWAQKEAAIGCYQSQFVLGRPQTSPTFLEQLRDQAAYWGQLIGARYGEPFACREPVGLSSMQSLL